MVSVCLSELSRRKAREFLLQEPPTGVFTGASSARCALLPGGGFVCLWRGLHPKGMGMDLSGDTGAEFATPWSLIDLPESHRDSVAGSEEDPGLPTPALVSSALTGGVGDCHPRPWGCLLAPGLGWRLALSCVLLRTVWPWLEGGGRLGLQRGRLGSDQRCGEVLGSG